MPFCGVKNMTEIIAANNIAANVLVEIVRDPTRITLRLYERVIEGEPCATGEVTGRAAFDEYIEVAGKHADRTMQGAIERKPRKRVCSAATGIDGDLLIIDEMMLDITDKMAFGKEWSDHAQWVFPYDGNVFCLETPFNRFGDTYITKNPFSRYRARHHDNLIVPLSVIVSVKTDDLLAAGLVINHGNLGVVGVTPTKTITGLKVTADTLLPQLQVRAPATLKPDAADAVELTVMDSAGALLDADCELTLEAVAGYIPNARVKVSGGRGSFKVMALGLEDGEQVRVKVGMGQFTGKADVLIKVVA